MIEANDLSELSLSVASACNSVEQQAPDYFFIVLSNDNPDENAHVSTNLPNDELVTLLQALIDGVNEGKALADTPQIQ